MSYTWRNLEKTLKGLQHEDFSTAKYGIYVVGGGGGREDVGAVKDDWKGTETITIT